jgi:hypothetical protein
MGKDAGREAGARTHLESMCAAGHTGPEAPGPPPSTPIRGGTR